MSIIIGWDIGGVHLKAARAEHGRITAAVQIASPLRWGRERIAQAFAEAKARIGAADHHVVTMTGELADTFSSRAEGVEALAALALAALGPFQLYAGRAGFVSPKEAGRHIVDVASANWHASASMLARVRPAALFIDMGSTTTDLVPIAARKVAARGYTDGERLAAGELVYTGLVRSAAMAIADHAPFAGGWTTLINENFATMADVHRILGSLPEGADLMATADGREKTFAASCARLARMVGRDAGDAADTDWIALARWLAEAQLRTIADAAMLVLSGARLDPEAPVVAAGSGAAVVSEVARRVCRNVVAFETLINAAPQARAAVSCCAPAAALALIAADPDWGAWTGSSV
jgi:(4-(4-[2-(gamma-L-glutamylamino)ethyl]phenoxymethyl)furan-2-yl)methanamine synthase